MDISNFVIETQHVGKDDGDERGHLLSAPMRERVGDTIFEGMNWPELKGKLFRSCRTKYGRCISKVYIDGRGERLGEALDVGWVFERRRPYEDEPHKSYIHEVRVVVLQPVKCDGGYDHLEPFASTPWRVA